MRTLILGAAPDSPLDELYVFAGPWCFAHCTDRFNFNWTFPPEPFADPNSLEIAACQARQLIGVAAGHLAGVLNRHHKVELSAAFWDTALAPWLSTAVEIVVDRLWRLDVLRELYGDTPLRLPLPGREIPRFVDSHDFLLRGALNPHWNHWLFGRLLEEDTPAAWKPEALLPQPRVAENAAQSVVNVPPPAVSFRDRVRRLVYALPFPRLKGFRLRDSLHLSLTLMGNKNTVDHTLPLAAFAEGTASPLSMNTHALLAVLEEMLPQSLLNTLPRPWPRLCTTRVAAVASADDDTLRLKLAWHAERGGRIIHLQHGGEYGTVRTAVAYAVAEYRHHSFVTWGWTCQDTGYVHTPPRHGELPGGACHATPLPPPQLELLRQAHTEESPTLLFVGTEMALIPYNLKSTRRTVQQLEYRAAKDSFLHALPQPLRAQTQYRPYFDLPCTLPDAPWLLERHPDVTRCTGPLEPHLLRCRLLVLDHLGTTLAQAFAAGTPLVIFHNPGHQPVAEDAVELLNLFADAGILFTSPTAAAAHCAAIWDDVPGWWNRPRVRKARDAFARRHALTTDGPVLPLWTHFLKTV